MECRGYRWANSSQPQAWCLALPLLYNKFLGLQKNPFLSRNDLQGMVKIRKPTSFWLPVHKLITYTNRTKALISFWSYLHIYWGLQCLFLWDPTDLKVKDTHGCKTYQVSLRFTSNSVVSPRGGTKWQNSALLWNHYTRSYLVFLCIFFLVVQQPSKYFFSCIPCYSLKEENLRGFEIHFAVGSLKFLFLYGLSALLSGTWLS